MLMHAVVHEGCTKTVRESALKFYLEKEQNFAAQGIRTRVSIAPVFSVLRCAVPTELFRC